MRAAAILLALGTAMAASQAYAVEEDDFLMSTSRDLYNLCTSTEADDMHGPAMGFCLGFVDGAKDYHDVVTSGDMVAPIACPSGDVTRKQVVDAFVSWAKANDSMLDKEAPIQGLMRAASAKWPCS